MSVGKALHSMLEGDLDAALAPSKKNEKGAKPKTAPGQLMAFTSELQAYEAKIAQLEAQLHGRAVSKVPVALIDPNPWQPRKHFDPEKLQELANSIKETRLLQPVVLRKSGDRYQLVAGERRTRAHKLLGFAEIEAFVIEVSDADMFILAVAENYSREDLAPYEIYQAIVRGEAEFPSRKSMAEALGMSRGRLYHFLAYQKLPELVTADLEANPRLLGPDTAYALASALERLGTAAVEALPAVWDRGKGGTLSASNIIPTLERSLREPGKTNTKRDIWNHRQGKKVIASFKADTQQYAIAIRADAMSAEKEEKLRALLDQLFRAAPGK